MTTSSEIATLANATSLQIARDLPKSVLLEMLRRMFRIRVFDEVASSVRLQFIKGALHNSIGQEGEMVGACMALRSDDYITGTHRSHGHPIAKGVPLAPLMAELFGKNSGICRGKGGSMHLADFGKGCLGESGIVAASIPAGVGAALSARLRGTDQVSLCFFGDGASNSGPFHEAANLASVWKLPVIFHCENNGYAMRSRQSETTSVSDIATRSIAYGMVGEVVDGQDALAVYAAVSKAVLRARTGGGPTLIEAKTYRYCDHQELEFELPAYRTQEEIDTWRRKDPIRLFMTTLTDVSAVSSEEMALVETEVRDDVSKAVEYARLSPEPEHSALFEDVFI